MLVCEGKGAGYIDSGWTAWAREGSTANPRYSTMEHRVTCHKNNQTPCKGPSNHQVVNIFVLLLGMRRLSGSTGAKRGKRALTSEHGLCRLIRKENHGGRGGTVEQRRFDTLT